MKKTVTLTFDEAWLKTKEGDRMQPPKMVLFKLIGMYNVKAISCTASQCKFWFVEEDMTDSDIRERVKKAMFALYSFDMTEKSVSISIEGSDTSDSDTKAAASESKEDDTENTQPQAQSESTENVEKPEEKTKEEKLKEVLDKINNLVGADEFKKLVDECVGVAPLLIKYNTADTLTKRTYLFSINDGDGLSTYLSLLSELFYILGLTCGEYTIVETELPEEEKNSTGSGLFSSIRLSPRFRTSSGCLCCIDISRWMNKLNSKLFRDFLLELNLRTGNNMVVFRVPFVEKEILSSLSSAISDVLTVKELSFVPFDSTELVETAQNIIRERGFSIEQEAWEVFNARITEEKNDGRFYGFNTVNKIIREMIYLKQSSNASSGIDDSHIKKDEILKISSTYGVDKKYGIELLDEFIGMETVKKRVEEIISQIEMSAKKEGLGAPCIHMRFVGNPGTGKTTVARVIGQVLKEKGILRNGNFFEHFGRDFCGRYVGETAPKTAAMCRDAYGSVLFIDEAYSLYRGDGHSKVDYGFEAIETLIAEMENHRTDLVVIMAGYPADMEALMEANSGLASRMPYIIDFPNYTKEQLFEIFMSMTKKNFDYVEGFEDVVKDYFLSLSDELVNSDQFSNARFVRNLFERTWAKAALRTQLSKLDNIILTKEDFRLAGSEKEFSKMMRKNNRKLGFI